MSLLNSSSKFLLVLLIISLMGCSQLNQKKFDSTAWKQFECTEMGCKDRWLMIKDLRKQKLVGMQKSQVIELLGKPDTQDSKQFSHYLGFTDKGINTGTLYLNFNQQESVQSIEVHDN